jgi:hypothetical protein
MSNNLIIAPTRYTPEVILDEEKRIFSVSGNCIDGTQEFFSQALENLDNVLDGLSQDELFTFVIKISNFEDRTIHGFFFPLFSIFEKYSKQLQPKKLILKWFYDSKDPDLFMKEAGLEYSDIFEIDFEFIPY